jgi:class 3 adenylate cyclase/TolB-like protein
MLDRVHHFERATRAVLFIDIVESVRLIEQDEAGIISRWLSFVGYVKSELLPACGGHFVKATGDGMLLEFSTAQSAISAAFAMQHAKNLENTEFPADRQILLRMGIEISNVIIEDDDVYGQGVNLAARLMNLAGPGEIVISQGVRNTLTPDLDADVEDLGECYVRHIPDSIRAYRIGPPGSHPVVGSIVPAYELRPTLAIVPFAGRDVSPDQNVIGEVLAEEMIRELSHSHDLNLISRLSTTAFRGRENVLDEISARLKANYILSGVFRIDKKQFVLEAELAEAKTGRILWSEKLEDHVDGIINGDRELIGRLVAQIDSTVLSSELERARSRPSPTLQSYTLLMGAIALMHRLSLRDFDEARHYLQTVVDRAGRQAIPQAWLAKWHVLRVQQGWSADPQQDAFMALDCTKRALDADPHCSLALAIDGFVHTNLLKRLDIALPSYELAIQNNPNESLAWLLKGTMHAFKGEGQQAVHDTQYAIKLSPLDPHRYFYDSLAATAHLADRQYDQALALAQRSLRANRTHTSTLRAMTIAQWQLGHEEDARKTAQELMKLEPTLTIDRYLKLSPSAPYETGKVWSNALRQAGVPD